MVIGLAKRIDSAGKSLDRNTAAVATVGQGSAGTVVDILAERNLAESADFESTLVDKAAVVAVTPADCRRSKAAGHSRWKSPGSLVIPEAKVFAGSRLRHRNSDLEDFESPAGPGFGPVGSGSDKFLVRAVAQRLQGLVDSGPALEDLRMGRRDAEGSRVWASGLGSG